MLLLIVLAATDSADPVAWLVNYGVAGIVILLLVTGQLRTKAEVAAIQKIADDRLVDLRQKDEALGNLIAQLSALLPQLARVGEIIEQMPNSAEAQLRVEVDRLGAKLDDIQRTTGR